MIRGGGILSVMSQARQRPLVGVSTYRQTTSWWAWERDAALVPGPYLDVLEAAGGQPVLIPPPPHPADERDDGPPIPRTVRRPRPAGGGARRAAC